MSYGSENYTSSSYRKNSGDSPRHASSLSRTTVSSSWAGGRRSSSLYRRTDSYNRTPGRPISIIQLEPSYDPIQSSAINDKIKMIRTNEKVQLQGLNDRFAMFIDKVHKLEQSNKVLETNSSTFLQWQTEPSRLAEMYEQQISVLRSQLDELNGEKSQLVIDFNRMEDDLQEYRERYEEEYRAREDAEFTLKKDRDEANVELMNLKKKVESLQDRINHLKKVHKQEVTELTVRIEQTNVSVGTGASKPNLTSALKDIRAEYESLAFNNQQSTVELYEYKIAELSKQVARSTDALRASREEVNKSRTLLQSNTIEIAKQKIANEALEKKFHEMEVDKLEAQNDLMVSKSDMARLMREYQDLFNVKMALDIEISAYRKLLEGEENRIEMEITHSGSSAIFTRSSNSSMREGKVEDHQQNKSESKVFIGFTEEREVKAVIESEVIDVMEGEVNDETEKQQDPSDIPTNQNN